MKRLFEINDELIDTLHYLESAEELTDADFERLELSKDDLAKKAESYVYVIKDYEAEIKKFEEFKKAAEEKIKAAKAKKAWLESSLLNSVRLFGDVEAGPFKVTTRKSKSLVIGEGVVLAPQFITVKTTETPDKKAITQAIKQGQHFEGVELKENQNLSIK